MNTDKKYPPLPAPTATAFGDEYESFDRNGKAMGKALAVLPYFSADQLRGFSDAATALLEERHAKELAAYALTVENLRAQIEARGAPDGFVLVLADTLKGWKGRINTLASLSLKAERYQVGVALKQDIADVIAAAPQPAAQNYTTTRTGFGGMKVEHRCNHCGETFRSEHRAKTHSDNCGKPVAQPSPKEIAWDKVRASLVLREVLCTIGDAADTMDGILEQEVQAYKAKKGGGHDQR